MFGHWAQGTQLKCIDKNAAYFKLEWKETKKYFVDWHVMQNEFLLKRYTGIIPHQLDLWHRQTKIYLIHVNFL